LGETAGNVKIKRKEKRERRTSERFFCSALFFSFFPAARSPLSFFFLVDFFAVVVLVATCAKKDPPWDIFGGPLFFPQPPRKPRRSSERERERYEREREAVFFSLPPSSLSLPRSSRARAALSPLVPLLALFFPPKKRKQNN
jgi:hypothetical protein